MNGVNSRSDFDHADSTTNIVVVIINIIKLNCVIMGALSLLKNDNSDTER